ncbi:MAG: hypothetical protein M3016_07210 [Actinomycetota bacterium]|nr:hypothetical protein [Actinomycetota bacterium]
MNSAAQARQSRAEVLKLARILHRDPESLSYLEDVPLADLQALRDQATDVLWSADGAAIGRLAAAGKLLPAGLNATLSERAFGPLLSARLAGQLEPDRAIDVAAKLPTGFLTDVAIELDPRRASEVIAGIPPQRIADITSELIRRGEYVTMGRFVGHISDAALRAALGAMDNGALLRVGFVMEDKDGLERLVAMLPARRMDGIIAAAAEQDLWLEALDLLSHLSEDRSRRIVHDALELEDAALESIVATVIEHELWAEVLLIAERDAVLQAKLADRLPALSAAQRKALARRAVQEGVIERLGPLGQALAAQPGR